jgi:lipopolysaccharide/colanic/teichoic acid biosynthesis glycosyltransferase
MKKSNIITIDKKTHIEDKRFQFALKRLMDIVLSLLGIIILVPIYLIIIMAIKLDSKGATVFKQV